MLKGRQGLLSFAEPQSFMLNRTNLLSWLRRFPRESSQFLGINSLGVLTLNERRHQVITAITIAFPVCLCFTFFNYNEGFFRLAFAEGVGVIFLLLAAYLQAQGDAAVSWAEWTVLLWGSLVTCALAIYGGIEGSGVLWIFSFPFLAFFLKGQSVGWLVSIGWIVICSLARWLSPEITDAWVYTATFTMHFIGAMLWATFIAAAFNLVRVRFMMQLLDAREKAELANNAKSKFLAATSHDLRQPLMAIDLFLSALAQTPLSSEQQRFVSNLDSSVKSMSTMLNTLLTMARLDSGAIPVNIAPSPASSLFRLIESEFASSFVARKMRFKLYFPSREIMLETDHEMLRALLRNLLGNTLKYCTKGGVLVGIRQRQGAAVIQVWDTGIGIEPEHIENVFEEYYQIGNNERDGEKGVGLGLAIVMRQARLIGATVNCRSRPGSGSVFEIMLPLATLPTN